MTTQQTTYRFEALGNSGHKSAEEHGFPSGKGRKKLFLAEIAFIGPFGTKMPQVQVLSPRPKKKEPVEALFFLCQGLEPEKV